MDNDKLSGRANHDANNSNSESSSPISNETLLFTTSKFKVVTLEISAGQSEKIERPAIRHNGAASILPIFEDGRVCLIENLRYPINQKLLEVPCGTIDPGESPLETAQRELTEETGFIAQKFELVSSYFVSPGIMDERMYVYFATDISSGQQQLMEDEQIEVKVVTIEEAFRCLDDGTIRDSKTMIALMLLRDRLKK